MNTDAYEGGLQVRKDVLGSDHVEASLAAADDLTQPLQDLVTEFAWGRVWTREALPHKTRSLLCVVMMVALNRPHELKLHVRGAVRNGCTREEIGEVILQTAVYAGFPAALDGFRVAKETLAEIEANDRSAGER